MALHLLLVVALLTGALRTYSHAVTEHGGLDFHLGMVVGLETIGSLLFLIPRTLRIGAVALLITLLGGFVMHLTRRELEPQLLVYAAGIWLIMVHGAEWGRGPLKTDAAV